MRRVIQSDLPIEYPITPDEWEERGGDMLSRFSERAPHSGFEMGISGFTRFPGRVDAVARRANEIQTLKERGYTPQERQFSDDELATGAGLNLYRFNRDEWKNRTDGQYMKGVPYALHLGNVEGPHGNLLIETIRRGAERRVSRALNLGCGSIGFQHRNIERAGIKDIAYADNNSYSNGTPGPSSLAKVHFYLVQFGQRDVRREFIELDKNNPRAVRSSFNAGSIGTVIRTGVGRMTTDELVGLRHVMAPDGELFVSNSIENQPIEVFLDFIEPAFEDIEIHVGYERYALICGKVK